MDDRNYWKGVPGQRFSRRRLMMGSAILGTGVAAVAAVGCGRHDSKSRATPSSASAGSQAVKKGGIWRQWLNAEPPGIDPYATGNSAVRTTINMVMSRIFRL